MDQSKFDKWLQSKMATNLEWFGKHVAPWLALAAIIFLIGAL